MYWTPPSAKQLEAFGVSLEDATPAAIELWPDNVLIKRVFQAMQTQWLVGGLGKPVGLNYVPLPFVMRRCGVRHSDIDDVFDGIRVMEMAALEEIHKE